MQTQEPEHDYVEYLLDVKDGQVVACEFFGEGRQVEPLTGVVVLMPINSNPANADWLHGFKVVARRIETAFRKLDRRR
jgi:hypothetical protein